MKKNNLKRVYEAPNSESMELQIEQCIAASGEITFDGDLGVMNPNDLENELGF